MFNLRKKNQQQGNKPPKFQTKESEKEEFEKLLKMSNEALKVQQSFNRSKY